MKTLLLNYHNKSYCFLLSLISAIFIFIYVYKSFAVIWLIYALLFLVLLINAPKWYFLTLFFSVIAICIFFMTKQDQFIGYINQRGIVVKNLSLGSVIKVHGTYFLAKFHHANVGDVVFFDGEVIHEQNTYLIENNINNSVKCLNFKVIQNSHSFQNLFKNYLSSGSEIYQKNVSLFLLGQKTILNKNLYQIAISLNVAHLFVISGFHIALIYFIFQKIFFLIIKNQKYGSFFAVLPILFYWFLVGFSIPITRATLLIVLLLINKYFLENKFTKIEILTFVMMIMFFWQPRQVTSLSFVLTFMATYGIFYVNQIPWKAVINHYFAISVFIYFWILPITISVNGFVSIFGLVFVMVLTPIFSLFYIASVFLFPFKSFLSLIYQIFNLILNIFNSLSLKISINLNIDYVHIIYLIPLISFIIYLLWSLYMDKKNI